MVTGTRWYARIRSSQVTDYGGPILMREHHSGAQNSSPPALMESVSSPLWWCTKLPITLKISITTYPVIG